MSRLVPQGLNLVDEQLLASVQLRQLLVRPRRLLRLGEELLLFRLPHLIADRRGALQGDALTPLVDVKRVAALEASRAGEFGVRDFVVVRHPVTDEMVARPDAWPEEPPLVTTENQMAV